MTIIGHSHLPRTFAFDAARVRLLRRKKNSLGGEGKLLVSAGSIGQPRDGDPRACYAIVDDQARTIEHQRVAYDVGKAATAILAAGLPAHFAQRLATGV